MSISNLTAKALKRAATLKFRIEELESALEKVLSVAASDSPQTPKASRKPARKAAKKTGKKRGRRKMSAEARQKIGDAQRRRWKAQNAAQAG